MAWGTSQRSARVAGRDIACGPQWNLQVRKTGVVPVGARGIHTRRLIISPFPHTCLWPRARSDGSQLDAGGFSVASAPVSSLNPAGAGGVARVMHQTMGRTRAGPLMWKGV